VLDGLSTGRFAAEGTSDQPQAALPGAGGSLGRADSEPLCGWGCCGVLRWWDSPNVGWQLSAVTALPAEPEPATPRLPGCFPGGFA